mmetsp:Transcript_853/g.1039  ORF Transcript_853/g.1039 Transcript_853/m.1039 type:complete len:331 (-) Transcript_853:91-1083(-)
MANSEFPYKKITNHDEDDDIEVQKESIKLSKTSNSFLSSIVIASGIGALLGGLFCGTGGLVIGAVLGYFISKYRACKCLMITAAVLLITNLILLVVFLSVGYFWTKDVVEHLTVSTPSPAFPIIKMADSELAVIKDRVSLFMDELQNPLGPSEDLIMTQDEINGIIGHSDYLRGNMMVTLHSNIIEEEYSLPMNMLPGGKNRYFVGSDYMKIKKEKNDEDDVLVNTSIEMKMETAAEHKDWFDGPLFFARLQYLVAKNDHSDFKEISELFLQSGYFFGHQASEEYINKRENLFQYICHCDDCENIQAAYDSIQDIVLEEGKIIIKATHHD